MSTIKVYSTVHILLISNFIHQRSNLANFHPHVIPVSENHAWFPEVSNASRSPGQENGPGFKGCTLGKVRNLFFDRKNHVLGVSVLDYAAVVYSFDGQGLGVIDHTWGNQDRAWESN